MRSGFLGAGFRKTELTASWAFSNSSGQPQPVEVSLACTPGKVKFVEGLDETNGGGTIDTIVGPITILG